jgi:uncharacterized protein
MEIAKFENARKYYERVEDYLLQHEAIHCLILGVSNALIRQSEKHHDISPYLVVVERNNTPLATAINIPPRKLILSKSLDSEAIAIIARDLASHVESLLGIVAPEPEATKFAEAWQSLTGKFYKLAFAMQVHQLNTIQPIPKAEGYWRLATESDRNLLVSWCQAFTNEALGDNEPEQDYQLWFERHLRRDSLCVWQDRVSVSMAAYAGATPNGIRINAVYTPPEYRGKGYASSCVATLSQRLLKQGYKYCFLFTDLANPTSNHIYQKIGYQPLCDMSNYSFFSS